MTAISHATPIAIVDLSKIGDLVTLIESIRSGFTQAISDVKSGHRGEAIQTIAQLTNVLNLGVASIGGIVSLTAGTQGAAAIPLLNAVGGVDLLCGRDCFIGKYLETS